MRQVKKTNKNQRIHHRVEGAAPFGIENDVEGSVPQEFGETLEKGAKIRKTHNLGYVGHPSRRKALDEEWGVHQNCYGKENPEKDPVFSILEEVINEQDKGEAKPN